MTTLEFFIDMIRGSTPMTELRERYARGIIRSMSKNQTYSKNGENKKLDKIYDELVSYKVKDDQAKSISQLKTLLESINGKKRS